MLEVAKLDPESPAHNHAVAFIQRNLRPEDLYEISAVGWKADQVTDVVAMGVLLGEVWLLNWNGAPVFIWGVNSAVAGIYGLWGFGTKETIRAMPAITRWGMKTWLPDFIARTNARRIEVRLPVSSVHSIKWLTRLGMIPETSLRNYSVIGEDFLQLAYTPQKDFKNVCG